MKANHTHPDRGTGLIRAIGVFPSYVEARGAIEALRRAGYQDDQIGVIGPNPVEIRQQQEAPDVAWEDGAAIGAATGGLAGLGFGTAVAAGLMSPLGPVVAAGAFVAILTSTGIGAAFGTVVGALAGESVTEEDARWYATELEAGRVVVTVRAPTSDPAQRILNEHGAVNRPVAKAAEPDEAPDTAIPGNGLLATPY